MSKSLAQKAALLNALIARREAIESRVKFLGLATSANEVILLKREHARVVKRIAWLESRLK